MDNQNQNQKHFGSVKTTWEVHTYDVWGNAKDGYDVNDVFKHGEVTINAPQTKYNVGTPAEFISAYPSDRQIKAVFGTRCQIETDGDDLHIEVTRRRDGYPIGSLHCTSHESLSPVRKFKTEGK